MGEREDMNSLDENSGIPVFLASDNNYAPYVATTIASVCYNTESFINFYVLDGGISDFDKKLIESLKDKFKNFSIEFINVNMDEFFSKNYTKRHLTKTAFARLLIPDLKLNIDKCIYLDVDIIALGDIKELYEQKLCDENDRNIKYVIGAVYESINDIKKDWGSKEEQVLKSYNKYFNSGVLLINCNKWREYNILSKILEINDKYYKTLIFEDQELLNLYFKNDYKALDSRFNYFYNTSFESGNSTKKLNTVIRHLTDDSKPWNGYSKNNNSLMENFGDFWFFTKMTPFYERIKANFEFKNSNEGKNGSKITRVKLFNFIPLLKISKKSNKVKVKLFNLLPVLSLKTKN
jgi:lipopolysaccharide biosynthesis glycosyltransferase